MVFFVLIEKIPLLQNNTYYVKLKILEYYSIHIHQLATGNWLLASR